MSTEEKRFYVYSYIDPRNSIPFYIGKGEGKRKFSHLKETYEKTTNKKKWSFIEGLKKKGITPVIEIVKDGLSSDEAYELEEKLIMMYGRMHIDPNGILTNVCLSKRPPVRTGPRKPHTEETKKKISVAGKGKMVGEKHPMFGKPGKFGKENAMFGTNHFNVWVDKYGEEMANSLELIRKEKIKQTSIGRKHTEETILKLKEFQKTANVGRIWISNDYERSNKFIWPEEINEYIALGWYKGKTGYNGYKKVDLPKKKWINNGTDRTKILESDPIPLGWKLGKGKFKKSNVLHEIQLDISSV